MLRFTVPVLCILAVLIVAVEAAEIVFSGKQYFLIIPVECYDIYLKDHNFTHLPCLKRTLSKSIGYLIIVAAGILKVPQMLIIFKAKDVSGISFLSQYFELLSFTNGAVYNIIQGNPISTYGENLLIVLQIVLIIIMMWSYAQGEEKKDLGHILFVSASYFAIIAVMFNTPSQYFYCFFWVGVAFTVCGRVPQIVSNFSNMHTGQLSFISTALMFAGSCARIFTSIQEVKDPYVLYSFLIGGTLNFTLTAQILFFSSNTKKFLQNKLDKKGKGQKSPSSSSAASSSLTTPEKRRSERLVNSDKKKKQ